MPIGATSVTPRLAATTTQVATTTNADDGGHELLYAGCWDIRTADQGHDYRAVAGDHELLLTGGNVSLSADAGATSVVSAAGGDEHGIGRDEPRTGGHEHRSGEEENRTGGEDDFCGAVAPRTCSLAAVATTSSS